MGGRLTMVVDWRLVCGNQEVIADIPRFRPTPPCTTEVITDIPRFRPTPPCTLVLRCHVTGPHWCDGGRLALGVWQSGGNLNPVPPYPTLHTGIMVPPVTGPHWCDGWHNCLCVAIGVIADIPRFRPTHLARCYWCQCREVITDIPRFRPTPPCTPVLLVPPVTGVTGPHWCDRWQTDAWYVAIRR
ncbi:hypothetical protein J6590_047899 [Homalodisca vitripennis]|nr:hypothetical protein J6590_047899 [Homalodisca vitripennis]